MYIYPSSKRYGSIEEGASLSLLLLLLTWASEEAPPANPRRVFALLQVMHEGTSQRLPRHRYKNHINKLFKESEEVLTWAALKAALHKRYGPTAFDDHFDDLTKLHQTGSVREYQLQFERLLSQVGRLSTQHQLGCFVSGLKGNLRSEVQAAKPATVTKAIGLARLYEARNWSLKKPPISYGNRIRETTPPFPSSTLTLSKPLPTKRLSLRCKTGEPKAYASILMKNSSQDINAKKFFMIEGVYATEEDWDERDPTEGDEREEDEPVISLHAITGVICLTLCWINKRISKTTSMGYKA